MGRRDHDEGTCKQCGARIPETKRRNKWVFGGLGRPRAFCDALCRKRHSRAVLRAANTRSIYTARLGR